MAAKKKPNVARRSAPRALRTWTVISNGQEILVEAHCWSVGADGSLLFTHDDHVCPVRAFARTAWSTVEFKPEPAQG